MSRAAPKRRRPRRRESSCEPLELRRLLTTVMVGGTSANDTIRFDALAGAVFVTVNGHSTQYTDANVSRFEFRTLGGDDTIEIDLREEDIKMDVFRASGAGGQHVNKTSSAVRLTHTPTGVVVSCQQERSQTKNRATAMKMLRAALYQRKLEEQEAARAAIEATKTDNSWGNQIRSYVFQPYTMVNDHRTEVKVGDVQRVMDGDLDEFIQAYLKRFGGKAA